MKNRILATLLTFFLALSTLSTSIYAEENIADTANNNILSEDDMPDQRITEDIEEIKDDESTNGKEQLGDDAVENNSNSESDRTEAGYEVVEGDFENKLLNISQGETGPDNDELFSEYVYNEFGIGDKYSTYQNSYSAGNALPDNDKKIYYYLVDEIKKIASGERSSTDIEIPSSVLVGVDGKYEYSVSDLPESNYFSDVASKTVNQNNVNYIINMYSYSASAIIDALMQDYSYEMYWYDKVNGTSYTQYIPLGYSWSYYGDGTTFNEKLVIYKDQPIHFSFSVASAYATDGMVHCYSADTAKTGAATAAVGNAKVIINSQIGKTDYDKLVAYKETICELVSYNHSAADNKGTLYGDPWQLIYVFDNDPETNVVCEGYSKAFKYLCDNTAFSNSGIYCLCADGDMNGGAHMWNIMHMEDGNNYLVDITNCDESTIGSPNKLFMRPASSGLANNYYVINIAGYSVRYTYSSQFAARYAGLINLATTEYNSGSSGSLTEHQDLDGDEICDHCGQIYGAYLATYSLSLEGNIGLNYKMELSNDILDNADEYYMYFVVNGRSSKVYVDKNLKSVYSKTGKDVYYFTCEVNAKEINDDISAVFCHEKDGKVVRSNSNVANYNFKVKDYCDAIRELYAGTPSNKLYILCTALLNYGGYAQLFFNHNTNKLANDGLFEGTNPVNSVSKDEMINRKEIIGTVEGISFSKISLNLETKISIRQKYVLEDGYNINEYSFSCNGKDLIPVYENGYYVVEVNNIVAKKLDEPYDVIVRDSNGNRMDVVFSVLTYCNMAYDVQSLGDLARSIYLYYDASYKYFGG